MHRVLKLDSLPEGNEGNVSQRAIWWSMHITQLLAEDTDLLMSLPDDATLIILPSDDPELCSYNLNLARNVKGVQVLVRLDQVDDRLVLTPYTQNESHTFRAIA
jgi:hypothetical protein